MKRQSVKHTHTYIYICAQVGVH